MRVGCCQKEGFIGGRGDGEDGCKRVSGVEANDRESGVELIPC